MVGNSYYWILVAASVSNLQAEAVEQGEKIFIIEAVEQSNIGVIQWLIGNKAYVDVQDESGTTALMKASAQQNGGDVVKLLLDAGAKSEVRDGEGRTALHYAAQQGSLESLEFLYKNVTTNLTDIKGRTPLHLAAERGDRLIASYLISKGEDPFKADVNGTTATEIAAAKGWIDLIREWMKPTETASATLMSATKFGQLEIVKFLVESGVSVNYQDEESFTPLHLAAESGNLSLVQLIVNSNGSIDAKNSLGRTPLYLAAQQGQLELVEYLISKNASTEVIDSLGNNLMHAAARNGDESLLELLTNSNVTVELKNKKGTTPLIVAAFNGNLVAVKYFVDQVSDLNTIDEDGNSLLFVVASTGNMDILNLIEESHINITYDVTDNKSMTPLHYASGTGDNELVSYIIDATVEEVYFKNNRTGIRSKRGARLKIFLCPSCYRDVTNRRDKKGRTPLHYAAESGKVDTIDKLIAFGGNFSVVDNLGRSPLHLAASKGQDADVINYLAIKSYELESKDNAGKSPLFLAVESDHAETLKHLIDIGADRKTKDKEGWTLVHVAAANGHQRSMEVLVEFKDLINSLDDKGRTPAWYALNRNQSKVLITLQKYGGKITPEVDIVEAVASGQWNMAKYMFNECDTMTSKYKNGKTLMHVAAASGQTPLVKELSKFVCLQDKKDDLGYTPAEYALDHKHWDTFKFLFSLGSHLFPDHILHRMIKQGNFAALRFLLENGGNINEKDNDGKTIIETAVEYNQLEMMEYLIDEGADFKGTDSGKKIMELAISHHHCEALQLLIKKGANRYRLSSHHNYGMCGHTLRSMYW